MTTVITVRLTALGRGAEGYMWAGTLGRVGGAAHAPECPRPARPCGLASGQCTRSPRTLRSPPARAGDAAVHLFSLPAQIFWIMAVLDPYRELDSQGPLCFETFSARASEFSGLCRAACRGRLGYRLPGLPSLYYCAFECPEESR